MKYDEMLDVAISMNETERGAAIKEHWQAVFSDGFVAYVQGQIEAGENMQGRGSILSGALGDAISQLANERTKEIKSLWESMRSVWAEMQRSSERQGNSKGMVGHSPHRSMPRGHSIPPAVSCYLCGSPVSAEGLCSGCLDTERDRQDADRDHDRQLHDQQLADLDHQRIQDDQRYYDNQADYNTYTDYGSSYIPDYSSDY